MTTDNMLEINCLRTWSLARSVVAAMCVAVAFAGLAGEARAEDKPVFADEYEAYNQLKKKLADLEKAVKDAAAKAPEIKQQTEAIKEQDAKIDSQIANLQYMDKMAFEKLGKGADVPANVALARAFIRDYPTSEYRPKAEEQLAKLTSVIEDETARRARAEEEARAAKKALEDKFTRREMSLDEIRSYLRGKSQIEIVKLMGEPIERKLNYWDYRGSFIVDGGKRKAVTLMFDAGRVTNVLAR
ncbi:hypothetical protein DB346_12270 [Verrucomicrobia bacterium LW23]|nr:hypothetical protein DB346_12270 [Verrucomicrobia bacterium LW23]